MAALRGAPGPGAAAAAAAGAAAGHRASGTNWWDQLVGHVSKGVAEAVDGAANKLAPVEYFDAFFFTIGRARLGGGPAGPVQIVHYVGAFNRWVNVTVVAAQLADRWEAAANSAGAGAAPAAAVRRR